MKMLIYFGSLCAQVPCPVEDAFEARALAASMVGRDVADETGHGMGGVITAVRLVDDDGHLVAGFQ